MTDNSYFCRANHLEMNKRHLLWIIPSSLAVLVITLYLLLPVFAKIAIHRKIERFEKEKNAELTISGLHIGLMNLHGIVPVSFENAHLKEHNVTDTLLCLSNVKAEVQIVKRFRPTDDLIALTCDSATMHLIHREGYSNYQFLLKNNSKNDLSPEKKTDFKQLSQHILQTIGDLLPETMRIDALTLFADVHYFHFLYNMSELTIDKGALKGLLTERYSTIHHTWSVEGNLDHAARNYRATLTDLDGNNGFAIINELKHTHLGFKQLSGQISDDGSDEVGDHYTLLAEADGLLLNHRYLATHDVTIDSTAARLHFTISPTRLTIDSTSVLKLNDAEIHPFFAYEKKGSAKPHITFIVNEKERDAKQLFGSIPDGLFQILPDLQLGGRMDFRMVFDCDFNIVDSLTFDFSIGSRDRSVCITSDADRITRFNAPFDYVFFENGDTARIVTIGPANPHFCPFDQIPPCLTKSILATEDAGFFQHRGFIKSSIREALIADIKAGRLRRGGSTLTMQLVKNLFLNRNKVFSRKIEEMMLVWLIEDYRLLSKERMFEIYVNIAEWGPDIIGIGEASEFYFGKKPKDLTLGECLYLASLIRAPKYYRSTLDGDGNITDNKREELLFVARRMVEREFITEKELQQLNLFIHTRCMDKEE